MTDLKNLIGKIGDFEVIVDDSTAVSFVGAFAEENGRMILYGRTTLEYSRLFDKMKPYRVVGVVDSSDITMMSAYILFSYRYAPDETFVTLKADASEILVGRQIKDDGRIRVASTCLPEIIWFFHDRLFESSVDFSRESPSLLEYCFPDDISVCDDYGTLTISRIMQHSFDHSSEKYTSIPTLQYRFNTPVSLSTARSQIAKARNLFLYFADGYIPLHDIELADERTSTEYYPDYCDFKMLSNFRGDEKPINEPFFVTSDIAKADMQAIWDKWNELYSHKFISALYYEIVCNRSTRINRFLNFSQAIDLFETTYRDAEVRLLAPRKKAESPHLPLSFYIKDSLLQLKDVLSIRDEDIDCISINISDARNYFTHYNDAEYREPSLPEIFAMSRVLHLVFLGLVYKQLGIPDKYILEAKACREYAVFERDISVILRKPIDNVDYTNLFG